MKVFPYVAIHVDDHEDTVTALINGLAHVVQHIAQGFDQKSVPAFGWQML